MNKYQEYLYIEEKDTKFDIRFFVRYMHQYFYFLNIIELKTRKSYIYVYIYIYIYIYKLLI